MRKRVQEREPGKVGLVTKSALALTAAASLIGAADVTDAHIHKRQTRTGRQIHKLMNRSGPSFVQAITDRNGTLRDDIFRIEPQTRVVAVPLGVDAKGKKVTKTIRIQRGALRIDISDQESLDTIRDRAEALSGCTELFGRQVVIHMGVPVAGLSTEDLGRLQRLGAVVIEDRNSKEAIVVGWIPTADKGTAPIGSALALFLLQVSAIAGRAYQRRRDKPRDAIPVSEMVSIARRTRDVLEDPKNEQQPFQIDTIQIGNHEGKVSISIPVRQQPAKKWWSELWPEKLTPGYWAKRASDASAAIEIRQKAEEVANDQAAFEVLVAKTNTAKNAKPFPIQYAPHVAAISKLLKHDEAKRLLENKDFTVDLSVRQQVASVLLAFERIIDQVQGQQRSREE